MRFSLIVALALPCVAAQLLGSGQPCAEDTECESRLCTFPYVGPGDKQCIPRPAPNSARCDKSLETTDCESGYCDADQSRCVTKPEGSTTPGSGTCTDDASCGTNRVCNEGTCLDGNLGEGATCIIDKQCNLEDRNPTCKQGKCTKPLLFAEPCDEDRQCVTGICENHSVDGAVRKYCLASAGQPNGEECDADRQCATFFCGPSDTSSTSKRCQDKIVDDSRQSSSSSSSSSSSGSSQAGGGGGSGSQPTASVSRGSGSGSGGTGSGSSVERVTVTSVSNGQTIRITSTRAAASAAGSAAPSNAAKAGREVGGGGWAFAALVAVLPLVL